MKRIVIGLFAVVLTTLLAFYGWQYRKAKNASDRDIVLKAGKALVERQLIGSKIFNVAMLPNHKESVNYVYNKMYGVEVTYERNGKMKKIIFPVSKYKDTWISPNNTEFRALDEKAEVVYTANPK